MNDNNFNTNNFLKTDLSTGSPSLDIFTTLRWIKDTNDKMSEYNDKIFKYGELLKDYSNEIEKQKSELGDIRDDVEKQRDRIPEIIGIFSAIIALVLIDVSIVKSVETFLAAILLVVALTCSMAIFAILIHSLFSGENKIKKNYLLIPVSLLGILVFVGVVAYFLKIDLYNVGNADSKNIHNRDELRRNYIKD